MTTENTGLLKKHHFRITKASLAVYNFLKFSNKPYEVSTIHSFLARKKIRINLATLYRILDKFLKKGLVVKVDFKKGRSYFEIKREKHHHHAVCRKCGEIKDINDCSLDQVIKNIQDKNSFKVLNHTLEFYGLCTRCG